MTPLQLTLLHVVFSQPCVNLRHICHTNSCYNMFHNDLTWSDYNKSWRTSWPIWPLFSPGARICIITWVIILVCHIASWHVDHIPHKIHLHQTIPPRLPFLLKHMLFSNNLSVRNFFKRLFVNLYIIPSVVAVSSIIGVFKSKSRQLLTLMPSQMKWCTPVVELDIRKNLVGKIILTISLVC